MHHAHHRAAFDVRLLLAFAANDRPASGPGAFTRLAQPGSGGRLHCGLLRGQSAGGGTVSTSSTALATVPEQVPEHVQAASALLRLAKPFFERILILSRANLPNKETYSTWDALRTFARLLLNRGAMQLTHQEAEFLRDLLVKCEPGGDFDFLFFHPFNERA